MACAAASGRATGPARELSAGRRRPPRTSNGARSRSRRPRGSRRARARLCRPPKPSSSRRARCADRSGAGRLDVAARRVRRRSSAACVGIGVLLILVVAIAPGSRGWWRRGRGMSPVSKPRWRGMRRVPRRRAAADRADRGARLDRIVAALNTASARVERAAGGGAMAARVRCRNGWRRSASVAAGSRTRCRNPTRRCGCGRRMRSPDRRRGGTGAGEHSRADRPPRPPDRRSARDDAGDDARAGSVDLGEFPRECARDQQETGGGARRADRRHRAGAAGDRMVRRRDDPPRGREPRAERAGETRQPAARSR